MSLAPDVIEKSLFADLKGEQRLMQFQDCTAEQLLHRYNVALAQAILLRSTGVSILITGESAQRFRQLFRAIKFHRLICEISSSGKDSYLLKLDGPLSLFSSTQKYGLQLAFFLPTVLQCHHFELTANVRWGTERKEKLFTLNQGQGLRSHLPDYGSYIPPDVKLFAESFRKSQPEWELQEEASIVSVGDGFWTPDFKLIHLQSKKFLFLELFGFWRRTDVDKHYQRLRASGKVPFLLAVGEQFNIDENPEESWGSEIYRFKRTPLPGEVVRLAAKLLDC